MNKKVNKKEIIGRIRAKKEDVSTNITFRIPKSLRIRFEQQCAKEGVSMAEVFRELIESFVNE